MNVKAIGLAAFGSFSVGLVVLVAIAFILLQWLGVPTGNFLDWIIGTASFWWLVAIVTIPWNVYFAAKEVQSEAERSLEKGIQVNLSQLAYVKTIARRSQIVAIALHLLSALGLYLLAATGISAIGYVSSGAALLLTALRPAIAFYQYLAARLQSIGEEVKYPRQDVVELRNRVAQAESQLEYLCAQLDPARPDSLTAQQQRQIEAVRQDVTRLDSSQQSLQAHNQAEHDRLSREAQTAIAQINADAEFLERARELIRFFKDA